MGRRCENLLWQSVVGEMCRAEQAKQNTASMLVRTFSMNKACLAEKRPRLIRAK